MSDYFEMRTSPHLLYPILVLAGIVVTVLSLYSISTTAGELMPSDVKDLNKDNQVQSQLYSGQNVSYGEATHEQRKKMLQAQHNIEKSGKCTDCNLTLNQSIHEKVWR
jgi:hypothetical protein